MITTDRLVLTPWTHDQFEIFSRLHADANVMADQGGPISGAEAEQKLARYIANYERHGFARWRIESREGSTKGATIGYCGVMASRRPNHPLGDHEEIGWRLFSEYWGQGYATEAAHASLEDVFKRTAIETIYSYTAPDNARSQSVMHKLNLDRAAELDFITDDPRMGTWNGLVWKTSR